MGRRCASRIFMSQGSSGDKTNKGILVNFIEVSLLKVLSLIIDLPFELSILE